VVDGMKAVGCAQTRRKGAVLIHAAVLLSLDAELYSRVFKIRAQEVAAGLTPAIPGGDPGVVGEAIAAHLAEALGLEIVQRALAPVPERFLEPYATEKWAPVKF
jgi:lipoate-protein ligase A